MLVKTMISSTLASYLVFDLESLKSTYDSIYDEMDLTDSERVNGIAIAKACEDFLTSFKAKTCHDFL